MIKDPENVNQINVFLRDGTQYTRKDIPTCPFGIGESEGRVVSFWHENKLRIIPMDLVQYVELCE